VGGEIRFTDCCEVKFSKVGVFFGFRFIVSIVASCKVKIASLQGSRLLFCILSGESVLVCGVWRHFAGQLQGILHFLRFL
jgi:hypothetical protein